MRTLRRLTSLILSAMTVAVAGIPCGISATADTAESAYPGVIQQGTDTTEVYNTRLEITNPAADYGLADPELRCYQDNNGKNVYWIYGTLNAADNIGAIYSTDNMKTWQQAGTDGKVLDKSTFPWAEFSFWAPGAIEFGGKYYVVFSANNVPDSYRKGGIGLGVADTPAGPFKAVGDNDGLIFDASFYGVTENDTDEQFKQKFANMPTLIDANLFVDDDGTVYLYYGGGGNLAVCLMNEDMTGIKAFPDGDMFKVITSGLKEYCEGPFMIKRGGKYYMTYSKGMWSGGSYASCYGVSDSPIGPFTDSRQILKSSEGDYPYRGPGHNSAIYLPENNMWLICYHRYNYGTPDRRPCIDRLVFNEDGSINSVTQTDSWTTDDDFGPDQSNLALNATAIDSGRGYYAGGSIANINDGDYITGWQYGTDCCNNGVLTNCWAGLDFGALTPFDKIVIDWESGTKCTQDGFAVEYSDDGVTWTSLQNPTIEYDNTTVITFDRIIAQYVRINMTKCVNDKYAPKITELKVFCVNAIDKTVNLALNGTAIDSGEAYYGANYSAANAIDGNRATGWQYSKSLSNLNNVWLGVEFDNQTYIEKAAIVWEGGTRCKENGYNIQYSDDGENWIDVADAVYSYGTSINDKAADTVTFKAIKAKYLRVNCISAVNGKYSPKIWEFEVYA